MNTPTPKSDKNTYNKHQDNCPTSVVPSLICRQLERELTAVTEQRDRLAEALQDAMEHIPSTMQKSAIEALAAVKGGSDESQG